MGEKLWYVRAEEKIHGPFSAQQIKRLAREGQLKPAHQIRRGEAGKWTDAKHVRGLFETAPTKPPAVSSRPIVPAEIKPPAQNTLSPPSQPQPIQPQVVYVQQQPAAQPMAAAHQTTNVSVVVHQPRGWLTLASGSCVFALLGWLFFCLPPIGWIFACLGILVGTLGIIGSLFHRGAGLIGSLAGTIFSASALVLPALLFSGILSQSLDAVDRARQNAAAIQQDASGSTIDRSTSSTVDIPSGTDPVAEPVGR